MTAGDALPATLRDLLELRGLERYLYLGVTRLLEVSGVMQYPMRACGDLEAMRLRDKVYWYYKAGRPIRRARRGSGLEDYFRAQAQHVWEPPEDLEPEAAMTISAAGDLLPHPWLKRSESTLYEEVADQLFGADLSTANLECPVTEQGCGYQAGHPREGPRLFCDARTLDVLSGYGERRYSFLATANNHSLDFGPEGVDSTLEALAGAGIASHGTNASDADAGRGTILERKGVRVGILSWTFGLNARKPPPTRPRLVNRTNLNDPVEKAELGGIEAQIDSCRRQGADFVLLQLHWGLEHEFYPTPEQVAVAHRLAELGADAIVGHHPHVVQPVEAYRTQRDPARVVPIFYSLGNLTIGYTAPFLCRSYLAHLDLVKGDRPGGAAGTYVARADVSAVVQSADKAPGTLRLRAAA